MKNIALTTAAFLAMSTFVIAGGDAVPVEAPVVEVEEIVASDAGLYIGAAYAYIENETTITNGVNGEVEFQGFMLQAGYKFNPYIAVEARYWDAGDERMDMSHPVGHPDGGDHTIDTQFDAWGVYIKPMYPVTEAFDLYAMLGWGNQNTVNDIYEPGDSFFSWGLGASYSFMNNVSVFVDYVSIYDETAVEDAVDPSGNLVDVEIQSASTNVGVSYSF